MTCSRHQDETQCGDRLSCICTCLSSLWHRPLPDRTQNKMDHVSDPDWQLLCSYNPLLAPESCGASHTLSTPCTGFMQTELTKSPFPVPSPQAVFHKHPVPSISQCNTCSHMFQQAQCPTGTQGAEASWKLFSHLTCLHAIFLDSLPPSCLVPHAHPIRSQSRVTPASRSLHLPTLMKTQQDAKASEARLPLTPQKGQAPVSLLQSEEEPNTAVFCL